eukprot:CAMPEP_0181333360 /NCGR_PEP_ID=MMETSP1101-20121128/25632_1 /TAXON_ID=46948 /ORGANISM="Rhodomonas abbreviata, Strain Caron Lab Isolate" /LENGTH=81 /DNA_ID=CAMNT_0023443159 /DNA_START=645 /DNA_END=887 /DNA_ORIENTATION=-
MVLHQVGYKVEVANIAATEGVVRECFNALRVPEGSADVDDVEVHDVVRRIPLHQVIEHMTANETAPPREQDVAREISTPPS